MKLKNLPFEDLNFSYFGPDLFWGPMPTVVYFSIDAHSSLCVDPFNQPVMPMANHSMRVFSIDLPEHGNDLDPHTAISRWAQHYQQGHPILEEFINKLSRFIDYLAHENVIDHRLGVMGLSRGAFMAAHLLHKNNKIKHLVGFAPLTDLRKTKEFHEMPQDLSIPAPISALKESLIQASIKFFIGNQDTRVSTHRALETLLTLCDLAQQQGIKSPQIESIIYPSIGHMGHGTPPHIFEEGALYMVKKLGFLSGL
jgi:esterase FrsA